MKTVKNSYPILREAKVINTTDTEKLGRIQLKVYPELAEIPDDDCPWTFPFSGGVHGKSFGVPLVGQLVSCIVFNRYWNEITFLPFNITKPEEHIFDKWMEKQRPKVKDMENDPEEEHLVVDQYEDDFMVFHDTKNNQHGFLHPTGTFFTINKDGSIWVQSVKKYTFHNMESSLFLEADSESGDIELRTKGNTYDTIDKNKEELIKENHTEDVLGNKEENIVGTALYQSADTDVKSKAPVGINGGGDDLGSACLRPYWDQEKKALTAYEMMAVTPVPILMWLGRKLEVTKQKQNDSQTKSKSEPIIK
jgi:hypothetical protein